MLKKLSIIILVGACNAYGAAETPAKTQAESGRRTSALLDPVTQVKDLQALILGYLGYLNSWMLDRTITLQDPHYSALARHFIRSKSPDGTYIALGYRERSLKGDYYNNYEVVRDSIGISESATRRVTEKLIKFNGEDFSPSAKPPGLVLITWSPDGKLVAFCEGSATINIWNVKSRTVKLFNPPRLSPWNESDATSLVFSPDGQQLAFGLCDSTIIILAVATAHEFKTKRLTDWCKIPSVYKIKIGEPSASNLRTTEIYKRLSGHAGAVLSVSWSPDGKQLASSSCDSTIKIWNGATGQLIKTLSGHRNQIDSVAWSPDGTCVASSSTWDATIKIWDLKTEESVTLLPCQLVKSVAWSHDGRRLFSRSSNTFFGEDAAIQIWENQIEALGSVASEAPAAPACRQASACKIM